MVRVGRRKGNGEMIDNFIIISKIVKIQQPSNIIMTYRKRNQREQ